MSGTTRLSSEIQVPLSSESPTRHSYIEFPHALVSVCVCVYVCVHGQAGSFATPARKRSCFESTPNRVSSSSASGSIQTGGHRKPLHHNKRTGIIATCKADEAKQNTFCDAVKDLRKRGKHPTTTKRDTGARLVRSRCGKPGTGVCVAIKFRPRVTGSQTPAVQTHATKKKQALDRPQFGPCYRAE